MYVGTDGKGETLYGTALIASGLAAFKHKPSAGDDSVTVLVDCGASSHYFDDLITPSLKHRLLNYAPLATPHARFSLPEEPCWTARPKRYFKAPSPTNTGNSILRGSLSSLCLA